MIRKIRIIGIICIIFFYLILNLNPIIANNFSTNQSSINDLNEDSEDFNIAKNLHFTYHFPNPKITINESENNFQHDFFIEKLPTTSKDGGNNFPFKELVILLPQNHIYESYSQLIDNTVLEYDSINTVKKLNQEIFPTEPIKINGNACYRGYSLLFVTIYPIYYDTKLENIIFANEISFSVETTEICDENSLFRDSTEDMQGIIKQIENPLMNTTYHKQMLNPTLQNDDSSDDIYKYVIITSNELEEYFNNFVAYKNNFISTRTMNLSYINSNFYGRDLQERIRESIRYAYQNWNTEYVLLGGDVNIIPYRGLFGKAIDHKGELLIDYDIPADIYYASLDGTWDDDGDGIYGEDQLNSICDEADLIAEVYVGRAPVENKAEVATFTNKVISFETSPKPKKILLHQSGVNTANDPDSTVIPEKISNWIPSDYEVDKLYQVNQVITIDDWKSAFEDNNFIIQHTGNGEEDQYYIDYPLQTFSVFQSLTLNNEFYPIHTSVSCHSGAFDNDDCLAETLILNPYGGASACLFNSRWGFTSENNIHKYSGELIERQFYELFWKNVSNLGKIHQFAKEYYYIDAMIDPAYRWCYYTLNLLGDPETPVQQTRQYSFKTTDFFVDDDYDNKIDGWNITHFNSIQASIDAASELDTIHVMNGIYNERLTIKKSIQLIGENKKFTIIDGSNGRGTISISASRVLIKEFTIIRDELSLDNSRIDVSNSNYVTISDCIITDSNIGIYATGSNNLLILNNTFTHNQKCIYASVECGNMYIIGNTFSLYENNSYGIYLQANGKYYIHNNTIKSHTNFSHFSCGIYIDGTSSIKSNIVTNCHIGLWLTDGVHNIEYNLFKNNKQIGIYAYFSSTNINNNNIEQNGNNFITYQNNLKPGGIIIYASKNEYCSIGYNKISNNRGYGIYLNGIYNSDNKIINNDFLKNSRQAFYINSRCYWQHNYWEKEKHFPKIILGFIQINSFLIIPTFQIDYNPSDTFHFT